MSNFAKRTMTKTDIGKSRTHRAAIRSKDGGCRYCYSSDGRYRYWLEVRLSGKSGVCMFLMLNPGTENENREQKSAHPTRKRCMQFAEREGYGTLLTCNLFALRSQHPKNLKKCPNPIGPDNDQHILRKAHESDLIVCAWGNKGTHLDRVNQVVRMLKSAGHSQKMHHLGRLTTKGQPRHPSRIESDAQLRPFD